MTIKYGNEFTIKMKNLLQDESDEFFKSLSLSPVKAITLNTKRMSIDKFLRIKDFKTEKVEGIDNGFYVSHIKFGSHTLNHLGVIYSQEPSAMYPVEMLDIKENDFVLDLCASPGGKSIQILNKLGDNGLLISNEIDFGRAKILNENLSRMGYKNFAITCNSPDDFEKTDLMFDKILVDAPCGGEGMFRKENFDFNSYNSMSIKTNAKRQLNILESILPHLKDGGKLVYSTCTYDIQENEEIIAEILKRHSELKLIDAPDNIKNNTVCGIKIGNTNTELCRRRYPHKFKGEGQFMALLQKGDKVDESIPFGKFKANGFKSPSSKDLDIIYKELSNILTISLKELNIVRKEENFYALPNSNVDYGHLNLLTIGTLIGMLSKGNFKIAHNFYHTYGDVFKNKIALTEKDLNKYLKGEEIDSDNSPAIYVVTYYDVSLGGGKIVNGRLKNYYPKNLRIN